MGGSVAAGIQSIIGNVAAGSVFAVCTSLGMTGVFASTAAVGAILGARGLAAYLKGIFNPKSDAELISKVIKEQDKPEIIIKLIESRFPKQRKEIKENYEELEGGEHNFEVDVENYLPMNMKEHFINMMIPEKDIIAKTEKVKSLLNNETFDKYFDLEFNEDKDANLIKEVIEQKDEPLIIVRLLNHRDESQRKKINDAFKRLGYEGDKKNLLKKIISFMTEQHIEIDYVHSLLDNIK